MHGFKFPFYVDKVQKSQHYAVEHRPRVNAGKRPHRRGECDRAMEGSIQIQRAEPLREQVTDAVLRFLSSGELVPGARVTEQGLAKALNVSRTPIREALGRLAQRGILQVRPGGGYVVPLPSVEELHDVIAVRLLLEPPAARMAAKEFDQHHIEAIDKAIGEEGDAVSVKNPLRFAQANEAFREAIFGAISNKALRSAIAQFNSHLHFIRSTTLKNLEIRKEILVRQRQIRDAIARNDADMAEALWKSYLRLTEDSLLAALQAWEATESEED